eukprot:Phypoly_transcript_10319.p1 GENE.Phypoly_transcript_10319~~Phypoly_transcript_10319.p1  ORF type:complete len:378 (+),score=53.45 Phypoly_transcript_10319:114-1247(+)
MKAFVLVLLITCVFAQNVPLVRYNLTQVNPLATCNDGTPAVVYLRSGVGSGANKFVIRLQGGAWCYDEDSCNSRAKDNPYWVSSNLCPPTLLDNQTISGVGHEGILSSTPSLNPYFYNWNHVYVWYCSSDSHLGNVSKSINGWAFNGKNIIHAVMQTIIKEMNLAAATDVLLTGDSAGGVGTVNNADFIGSFVNEVAPNANYRAFVDCAWFLNIAQYNSDFYFFQNIAKQLLSQFNAVYDATCAEKLGENQWMCFHTQYAWTYLSTMAFYAEFQFDSANLGYDGAGEPFDSGKEAFALSFQKDMLSDQAQVPHLFSASCYLHEVIDGPLFTNVHIGNTSISDAVGQWFFAGSKSAPPPPARYVDTCSGIACNPTCKT